MAGDPLVLKNVLLWQSLASSISLSIQNMLCMPQFLLGALKKSGRYQFGFFQFVVFIQVTVVMLSCRAS